MYGTEHKYNVYPEYVGNNFFIAECKVFIHKNLFGSHFYLRRNISFIAVLIQTKDLVLWIYSQYIRKWNVKFRRTAYTTQGFLMYWINIRLLLAFLLWKIKLILIHYGKCNRPRCSSVRRILTSLENYVQICFLDFTFTILD